MSRVVAAASDSMRRQCITIAFLFVRMLCDSSKARDSAVSAQGSLRRTDGPGLPPSGNAAAYHLATASIWLDGW